MFFVCVFSLSYAHCVLLLVFLLLTDVLLVMEAVATNRSPCSEEELQTVRSTRLVLQWMPSRCGIEGHEETCLAGCGRRAGRKQGHPHRDEDSQWVCVTGAVSKMRRPSWAPIPNKPTVSVDVKQHSANPI